MKWRENNPPKIDDAHAIIEALTPQPLINQAGTWTCTLGRIHVVTLSRDPERRWEGEGEAGRGEGERVRRERRKAEGEGAEGDREEEGRGGENNEE